MPDLLIELRSEEIPARMQRAAAGELKKRVTDGLFEAGLTYEAAREFWTPRRLALNVTGVSARSKDVRENGGGQITHEPFEVPGVGSLTVLRAASGCYCAFIESADG